MVSGRNFARAVLVLAAFTIVAGIALATVAPYFSGHVGGLSAGPAYPISGGTTIINGPAISIQGTTGFAPSYGAGSSPSTTSGPSTTILGVTTVTETASSTATEVGQGAEATSYNGTVQASSGHSVEFFGNLTLSASDPSAVLQKAGTVASALGGYVAYSVYGNSLTEVTVRVPSQDYQEALTQLESLGTVVSFSSSSDDVTVQYTDLNATLQSLLTEQASLLKLLNQSSTVNATLSIESVLQQTDAQINSVESSILQTGQLVEFGTIGVDIIQAQSAYTPMSIKLSATPITGMSPLSVTFNAVVKGGEPSYFVDYNFGDGTSAQGVQLIHQFTEPGKYNVTVSATDQSGNVSLAWIVVNVTSPPVTSGLAAFGDSVLGLFTTVIGAIIEVAVVVLPVGLVILAVGTPLHKRYLKNREGKVDAPASGSAKDQN
jgi:hypothetical protein